MYRSEMKQLISLLQTLAQALSYYGETGDARYLPDCAQGLQTIDHFLHNREPSFQAQTLHRLMEGLAALSDGGAKSRVTIDEVTALLEQFYRQLCALPCKLRLLFLPYIVQMWTSFESIWRAADRDPDCEALVVPIPYYKLLIDDDDKIIEDELVYEGLKYPDYVPVLDYHLLSLDTMQPDAIFIHNPYDYANTLTRLPQEFFSSSLREKTDCLVYSTYGIVPAARGYPYSHNILPAYKNADLIVVPSEMQSEIMQQSGIPEQRILVTGAPKIDHIVSPICPPFILEEWKQKMAGRKVFLLNTHVSTLFEDYDYCDAQGVQQTSFPGLLRTKRLIQMLLDRSDCALIWRPHPLLENMLESRNQLQLLHFIKLISTLVEKSPNAVRDKQPDYLPAFCASDAIFTASSSLVYEYLATGKPIFEFSNLARQQAQELMVFEEMSINMRYIYRLDDFTHMYSDTHWLENFETQDTIIRSAQRFIDMVVAGRDPFREAREETTKQAFLNIANGGCGRATYLQIKTRLLDAL